MKFDVAVVVASFLAEKLYIYIYVLREREKEIHDVGKQLNQQKYIARRESQILSETSSVERGFVLHPTGLLFSCSANT